MIAEKEVAIFSQQIAVEPISQPNRPSQRNREDREVQEPGSVRMI